MIAKQSERIGNGSADVSIDDMDDEEEASLSSCGSNLTSIYSESNQEDFKKQQRSKIDKRAISREKIKHQTERQASKFGAPNRKKSSPSVSVAGTSSK